MSDGEQPDESQKTEDPTPKKLEESRKKGQIALSREVNNWVMLMAATLLIAFASMGTLGELKNLLRTYLEHLGSFPQAPGGLHVILGESFKEILKILFLPLLVLMAAAFLGPFLQIGPLFAPEVIKPDLSKISLIKGVSRLFSMRSLMEFAKGLLKIGIVSAVSIIIIYPYYGNIEHMVGLPMPLLMEELKDLVVRMMTGVMVVMIIVAVIDLVFQRNEHHKKMRMTKQEVKDEYKQTEGDPHVRARLRQLRAERGRQRMMQNVPNADVVITNPTHYSIALQYDPDEMDAPKCLAKGVDEIALRIREVAKENNIELYENKPLARALFDSVEIDETIPQEHYQAVAQIISYVFQRQGKLKPKT